MRVLTFLIIISLLLAACSSPTTVVPEVATLETATPEAATSQPATPEAATPTVAGVESTPTTPVATEIITGEVTATAPVTSSTPISNTAPITSNIPVTAAIPASTTAPVSSTVPVSSTEPVTVTSSNETTNSVAGSPENFIWNCYSCSGGQAWSFKDGQAERIDLPVGLGNFFGFARATNRILYSTPFGATGGGPSQIAVHDLWMLNPTSGHNQALIREPVVVEGTWAPDGEHIAYVLATDTTYELHWLGPDGEDKMLAPDVAFTFSVSPDGRKVAFTRESNYQLPGEPGLYVVDVTTGEETKISDVDRAGAGGIDDHPAWAPSGDYVLLPTYGAPESPGLIRAMVDGSDSVALTFDPALADEEWYQVEPFNPFSVSDEQFIAAASLNGNAQQGGDATLILYQLNDTHDTITGAAVIGTGTLVGWDVPGASLWLQTSDGMVSVPLPIL